jgi:hypothetical protein
VLAVNPCTGGVRWTWGANLKGVSLAPVLARWQAQGPACVVWDGAPGHRSLAVRACGATCVALPPYLPELDPAERVFRAIRPEIEGGGSLRRAQGQAGARPRVYQMGAARRADHAAHAMRAATLIAG